MGTKYGVKVKQTKDGEQLFDYMLVERDTPAEAEQAALAAFNESGEDWTLDGHALEEAPSEPEALRFDVGADEPELVS